MAIKEKQLSLSFIGSTLLFVVIAFVLTIELTEAKLDDAVFPYVPRNEEGWLRACVEEKNLKSQLDKTKDTNARNIAYDFYLELTNFRTDLGVQLGKGAGCPAKNAFLRAASIPGLFRRSMITDEELFGHIERSEKGLVQACAEEAKLKQDVDKIKDLNSLARLIAYVTYTAYLKLRTDLGVALGLGATCPSPVAASKKIPVKVSTTPAPAVAVRGKPISPPQRVSTPVPPPKTPSIGRLLPSQRKQPTSEKVIVPEQVESQSNEGRSELSGELGELKVVLGQILDRINAIESKIK